jgi:hypothetical protein
MFCILVDYNDKIFGKLYLDSTIVKTLLFYNAKGVIFVLDCNHRDWIKFPKPDKVCLLCDVGIWHVHASVQCGPNFKFPTLAFRALKGYMPL